MSKPSHAGPAKLVMSVIAADSRILERVLRELSAEYGFPDYVSAVLSFDYTDYYAEEMGSPLVRRFISFEKLLKPESLPDVKRKTNAVEDKYAEDRRRRVNIDPGYLNHAHLILATGKGYTHRPYLRDGIYADLTLMYQHGSFCALPWTYPDYAAKETIAMFNILRSRYTLQIKKGCSTQ